ncbi:MAG: 30S ribosome-binding factor RbfA [Oscillospiraceae bacterium]|nr:30S ribosome-binding factor RbfA [Oscillospiraceae bacterium]
MPGYKKGRDAEDIKREITAIIRELKDPRVAGAILTVVRVEVSSDLSYGKVYISAVEGIDAAKAACKALENAKGLIRHEVGSRLGLRKAPDFKFIADDSVEKGIEMFKKLKEV